VAKEEKRKGARKKEKDYGYGRVMGIEVIEQRDQEARDKAFLKAWKEDFTRINLDVFAGPKAKPPCKKRTRKGKEKALEATVAPLALLDPSLFNDNLEATSIVSSPIKEKRKASEDEPEIRT
jgi:hypothetical protein